jgi:hypothetical protein
MLAHRLQETLTPLWRTETFINDYYDCGSRDIAQTRSDGTFVADSESEREESIALRRFAATFDIALDVKCRLLATGRRFEFVWEDAETSIQGSEAASVSATGKTEVPGKRLKLTLLPGIMAADDTKVGELEADFSSIRVSSYGPAHCFVAPKVWVGTIS